jgi:hypothetical protein
MGFHRTLIVHGIYAVPDPLHPIAKSKLKKRRGSYRTLKMTVQFNLGHSPDLINA